MRTKRVILWGGSTLTVLICLILGYYHFMLDWEGRPMCHKQIMLAFMAAMHPSGVNFGNDRQPFPNVNGSSQESLATLSPSMPSYMDWTNDYNYVPGLREDDPPDLVLLYFNRPTRWNWHAAPPSVFERKAWIIVPVDFGMGRDSRPQTGERGESSERVSFEEFRVRLKRTLDFIRTNERPGWRTIVEQNQKFLDSFEHGNR